MGGELKEKVAQGVAWSMAEKIGSMLLAMAVRLVILRLLTRDILGFMSIPSAVVTVLLVIVDSGFSQSLVRHKGPSQSDYKSVFLFNIAVSAVLYGVLVALAPLAARWYGMPEIARIAPVFFLLLPLNALCAVQNTIFIRQFRFALLSKVTFLSSLAGGLTAIALAMAGWGIWSLVAERVIAVGMRTALLWWLSDWRPCGKCGLKPLREMAPFGCSLMVTDLISNFYNKIPQFFLGKLYSPAVLGSFDQAVKLKDMPAATGIQAVQNVTFPALAKIRDDAPKFAEGYRQVVMVVSYVMFPIMLGMSAVARDMFAVLLGEEWMPTVPYFEAVCLAGLFSPIALTAYNVLKARCKGPLIVRLEVVKKIIMTAIFAVTIPHSVMAVVWGLVAIAFCEMAVNFLATTRFTSLTFRRFVRTLLPVALVSGTMYLLVRLTAAAIPGNDLVRLLAELATGVVSYLALSALFRLEARGADLYALAYPALSAAAEKPPRMQAVPSPAARESRNGKCFKCGPPLYCVLCGIAFIVAYFRGCCNRKCTKNAPQYAEKCHILRIFRQTAGIGHRRTLHFLRCVGKNNADFVDNTAKIRYNVGEQK